MSRFWLSFGLLLLALVAGVEEAGARAFAYVTNSFSNTVSVIDVLMDTVVSTVGVGAFPFDLAVTPDGRFVWVANRDSNTISVVEVGRNQVVATLAGGLQTNQIAFTPDGQFAYVTMFGLNQVWKFEVMPPYSVVKLIDLTQPHGVAVKPDGAFVYVTQFAGNVAVISTTDDTVVQNVPVGLNPLYVAFTPDGTSAFVTNANVDSVSAIDTTTYDVTNIPTGDTPLVIGITPDGATAYVTLVNGPGIAVIDTASKMVVQTITDPALTGPEGLGITPDGTLAYVVGDPASDAVVILDLATGTIGMSIAVGDGPFRVAVTPEVWALAVRVRGSGSVSSSPAGIECPGTCVALFLDDKPATLTATPVTGWSFIQWAGACAEQGNPCTLTMDSDKRVGALFRQDP